MPGVLSEEEIRRRFQAIIRALGVPHAKDIGQHEMVSNAKMEALDAAAHDEAIIVRELVDKNGDEAKSALTTLSARFQTPALRELLASDLTRKFFRGL